MAQRQKLFFVGVDSEFALGEGGKEIINIGQILAEKRRQETKQAQKTNAAFYNEQKELELRKDYGKRKSGLYGEEGGHGNGTSCWSKGGGGRFLWL